MRPLEGQGHLDPETDYVETDDKLCGIYSSEARALEAQRGLAEQPGFCDYPDSFYVECYRLDVLHWTEGFTSD